MKMLKPAIVLVVILQGFTLSAQESALDMDKFLVNLARYRADLLTDKDTKELTGLITLMGRLSHIAKNKEEYDDFIH